MSPGHIGQRGCTRSRTGRSRRERARRLRMRKKFLGAVPVALAAFALVASIGTPAMAAATRSTSIRGGGSDTTYAMMQKLDDLYNGSPGCVVLDTVPANQDLNGKCYPDVAGTNHKENYH